MIYDHTIIIIIFDCHLYSFFTVLEPKIEKLHHSLDTSRKRATKNCLQNSEGLTE